ncbi:unnamed protein product [Prorocentrum cordatum]|uniref:Uncharacterized protein n=1 Tax=Prorocentrum cordatum TaxID=2364126 RepID=A0ABN9V381_9DINO|nr:unnamed protein product [Polarella glacialis]
MPIICRTCGGEHWTARCPESVGGGTNPAARGTGRVTGDRGRGGSNSKTNAICFNAMGRLDQRRLLLAWASLQESALTDPACKGERNEITHATRCFHLESNLAIQGKFVKFKAEYCKWEKEAELDTYLVHALAFIHLLGQVREILYNHEGQLCESIGGEMRHGPLLNECLVQHNIDITMITVELKALGIFKFKRINRLRNAFVKQSAGRWNISCARAKEIGKELNDLCISEEGHFVDELQRLTRNDDINITPDEMLGELRQDDAAESGKRLEELDVNAMQLLHAMHKAWFTLRGPPRHIGLDEIKGNALKAAHVCNGAFLDIHRAVADACPESGLSDISRLPDIGTVIEESLSALGEAGMKT